MPDEEHGSFSLGFTFGLLAGGAGFFVFGTESGKKRRSLEKKNKSLLVSDFTATFYWHFGTIAVVCTQMKSAIDTLHSSTLRSTRSCPLLHSCQRMIPRPSLPVRACSR